MTYNGNEVVCDDEPLRGVAGAWKDEDAEFIATAFNAATACEDMGYDGGACVRALPELVKELHAQMTALKYITDALDIVPDTTYIAVKNGDKIIAKVTLSELDARAESVMEKCRG